MKPSPLFSRIAVIRCKRSRSRLVRRTDPTQRFAVSCDIGVCPVSSSVSLCHVTHVAATHLLGRGSAAHAIGSPWNAPCPLARDVGNGRRRTTVVLETGQTTHLVGRRRDARSSTSRLNRAVGWNFQWKKLIKFYKNFQDPVFEMFINIFRYPFTAISNTVSH